MGVKKSKNNPLFARTQKVDGYALKIILLSTDRYHVTMNIQFLTKNQDRAKKASMGADFAIIAIVFTRWERKLDMGIGAQKVEKQT